MPFRETCVVDETVRFVSAYLAGEGTMTKLCQRFGISREWGYALVRRYRAEGAAGLAPRSRAPQHPGRGNGRAAEHNGKSVNDVPGPKCQ